MLTSFQKDILIADLHRQIYEAQLLGQPNTQVLNLLVQEREKVVYKLEQVLLDKNQIFSSQQAKSQQDINYLNMEKDRIYNEINLAKKDQSIYQLENQQLEKNSSNLINLIQLEASTIESSSNNLKQIQKQCSDLWMEERDLMHLKQQMSEAFEGRVKQNCDYLQRLQERDEYYQQSYKKYQAMVNRQEEMKEVIDDVIKNSLNKLKILQEDQMVQDEQNYLLQEIDRASQEIDALNCETDTIIGNGSSLQSAVERENKVIQELEAKLEHLEGLLKIQDKHKEGLEDNLYNMNQETQILNDEQIYMYNESCEIKKDIEKLKECIEQDLEYLILRGHKTEFIEQIIRKRDRVNHKIIKALSPRKITNIQFNH